MTFTVRLVGPEQDDVIATNFYRMWQDFDMHSGLVENWRGETLAFIAAARDSLEYNAFVAEAAGTTVGSAACQVFGGLYPSVFRPSERKYGYVWGVYVAPPYRGWGIAKALTGACTDHLKSIGCTRILLHASPMGRPLYETLGFVPSNELKLEL